MSTHCVLAQPTGPSGFPGDQHQLSLDRARFAAPVARLLSDLAAINEKHLELTDTAVREEVAQALQEGFVNQTEGYAVPGELGMYSKAGNRLLRAALNRFITCSRDLPTSPELRRDIFDRPVLHPERSEWDYGHYLTTLVSGMK